MLKQTFIALVNNYTDQSNLAEELWAEIEKNYSNKKRYYHTLEHLQNLLLQLNEIKSEILNWNALLFTLFYHDIIYNVLKSDNEEKSATLAEKRMKKIGVPQQTIEHCKLQILATKSHLKSTDSDTNFFTDADLAILGQPWETYAKYIKNIRKEFSLYPSLVYIPGRQKVLKHFLAMNRIYKIDYFHNKFEKQANENLNREIVEL